MEHDLSISSSYTDPDGNKVRGRITVVRALTHLGKLPLYPYPQSFQGRFLGVLSDGKLVGLAQAWKCRRPDAGIGQRTDASDVGGADCSPPLRC